MQLIEERPLDACFDIAETPVKLKFLILSSPRTGSTALTRALAATGAAGVPLEYLHADIQQSLQLNPANYSEYLSNIVRKRTSPNGAFGLKLHFNQFMRLFQKDPTQGMPFIRMFDRHIIVYRRDKILQAISEMLALENNQWVNLKSGNTVQLGREFVARDVSIITGLMHRQIQEQRGWLRVTSELGIAPLQVAYEDLTAEPAETLAEVAAYLGISFTDFELPTAKTTNTDAALAMKAHYLEAIGAAP